MTTTPDADHEVRHYVDDLYHLIDVVARRQNEHGERLDTLAAGQVRVEATLEHFGTRLNSIEITQSVHSEQLRKVSAALIMQGATQAEHGKQLAKIARRQDDQDNMLKTHGTVLKEHGNMLKDHGSKLDRILELLEAPRA